MNLQTESLEKVGGEGVVIPWPERLR